MYDLAAPLLEVVVVVEASAEWTGTVQELVSVRCYLAEICAAVVVTDDAGLMMGQAGLVYLTAAGGVFWVLQETAVVAEAAG